MYDVIDNEWCDDVIICFTLCSVLNQISINLSFRYQLFKNIFRDFFHFFFENFDFVAMSFIFFLTINCFLLSFEVSCSLFFFAILSFFFSRFFRFFRNHWQNLYNLQTQLDFFIRRIRIHNQVIEINIASSWFYRIF